MATYKQDLARVAEQSANEQWKAENERGKYLIKSTFVQILDCTANDRAFLLLDCLVVSDKTRRCSSCRGLADKCSGYPIYRTQI
jgi:hypothetical protein